MVDNDHGDDDNEDDIVVVVVVMVAGMGWERFLLQW